MRRLVRAALCTLLTVLLVLLLVQVLSPWLWPASAFEPAVFGAILAGGGTATFEWSRPESSPTGAWPWWQGVLWDLTESVMAAAAVIGICGALDGATWSSDGPAAVRWGVLVLCAVIVASWLGCLGRFGVGRHGRGAREQAARMAAAREQGRNDARRFVESVEAEQRGVDDPGNPPRTGA